MYTGTLISPEADTTLKGPQKLLGDCYAPLNITKDGELTYDATLDKRFIDYFKGTKGSEKYL